MSSQLTRYGVALPVALIALAFLAWMVLTLTEFFNRGRLLSQRYSDESVARTAAEGGLTELALRLQAQPTYGLSNETGSATFLPDGSGGCYTWTFQSTAGQPSSVNNLQGSSAISYTAGPNAVTVQPGTALLAVTGHARDATDRGYTLAAIYRYSPGYCCIAGNNVAGNTAVFGAAYSAWIDGETSSTSYRVRTSVSGHLMASTTTYSGEEQSDYGDVYEYPGSPYVTNGLTNPDYNNQYNAHAIGPWLAQSPSDPTWLPPYPVIDLGTSGNGILPNAPHVTVSIAQGVVSIDDKRTDTTQPLPFKAADFKACTTSDVSAMTEGKVSSFMGSNSGLSLTPSEVWTLGATDGTMPLPALTYAPSPTPAPGSSLTLDAGTDNTQYIFVGGLCSVNTPIMLAHNAMLIGLGEPAGVTSGCCLSLTPSSSGMVVGEFCMLAGSASGTYNVSCLGKTICFSEPTSMHTAKTSAKCTFQGLYYAYDSNQQSANFDNNAMSIYQSNIFTCNSVRNSNTNTIAGALIAPLGIVDLGQWNFVADNSWLGTSYGGWYPYRYYLDRVALWRLQ